MTETIMTPSSAVPKSAGNAALEQAAREQELVDRVVASFNACENPRLRQIMQSLSRHLHAFIRDVRLTEPEWDAAIRFLTDCGNITDEHRQEFILLSDVLGASMQTITVDNQAYKNATEATVFGPFHTEHAPHIPLGGDIAGKAPGMPCWVEGAITDTNGHPISGARIEVWQADDNGLYDVQYDDDRVTGRAWLQSDKDGKYYFWCLKPTPYPIPHDGPVGQLLRSVERSPYRASHLHFMVTAPGYRRLVTHIFVAGDPQLDAGDSVFGVKDSLITAFEDQDSTTPTPDGNNLHGHPWTRTRFNIVLAPEGI